MQRNNFMTIVSYPQLITLQTLSIHHPGDILVVM